MLTILTAVMAGILGGAFAGAAVGWCMGRRQAVQPPILDELKLDADLDEQITTAARGWARRQDQPAAAPLVADKLRLAYVLSQRRVRRRERKRSR
jgi:hypothetical protein